MTFLRTLFATQPAIVIGAVSAVLAVAIAFQLPLTSEQAQAIVAAFSAMFTLGSAIIIHGQVYAPATVDAIVRDVQAPLVETDPTPVARDAATAVHPRT